MKTRLRLGAIYVRGYTPRLGLFSTTPCFARDGVVLCCGMPDDQANKRVDRLNFFLSAHTSIHTRPDHRLFAQAQSNYSHGVGTKVFYLARDARKNKGMPRPLVGPRRHEVAGVRLVPRTLPLHALIRWCRRRTCISRALSVIVTRVTVNPMIILAVATTPDLDYWLEQHNKAIASQTIVRIGVQHGVPWPSAPAAGKTEDLSGKHLGNHGRRAFSHVRKSSDCRARHHGACINKCLQTALFVSGQLFRGLGRELFLKQSTSIVEENTGR